MPAFFFSWEEASRGQRIGGQIFQAVHGFPVDWNTSVGSDGQGPEVKRQATELLIVTVSALAESVSDREEKQSPLVGGRVLSDAAKPDSGALRCLTRDPTLPGEQVVRHPWEPKIVS